MAHKASSCAAGLLVACTVFAGSNAKDPAHAYDLKSESKFTTTIVEVREVAKGQALPGIHLTVSLKESKVDLYVGPKEFVKLFDVSFKAGQEIDVIAAKVSAEGGDGYLAREIRLGQVTLVLRDETGWPNWDWNKPTIPTGL